MLLDLIKVFLPALLAFALGIGITPVISHYLYTHKMWKKKVGKGEGTPLFNKLHETRETGTPRMGGVIIWISATIAIVGIYVLASLSNFPLIEKLDFLNRNQTWIPFAALFIGACIGLIDDLFEVRGTGDYKAGGLSLGKRLLIVGVVGLLAGLWFHYKLDVTSIGIPYFGPLALGWLIIPLFALVMLAVYSGGIIDGIDGLAGGIFAVIFGAYGVIAFFQSQINLAAFCAALLGGILAFLWFNIPPARFYMSETGSMALTLTLAIVAFMTDSLGEGEGLFVLPIIAFPLFATSASVILQKLWKRFFGKKLFIISPLHHHFEAIGWPSYKVTMRYWVLSVIFALLGLIVTLVS
ncbi:MAG: Phospho-N-acetylmuramoyl-pentapeptide-transferase [Parcubacteria group bacterium GW2011_GWA2_49_9]|nr:MAG: Phospho-N-acetylmuramoyl-pentapeptide-transferase [Parcubacteria group bacterium GW2011_GWA2_49_9]